MLASSSSFLIFAALPCPGFFSCLSLRPSIWSPSVSTRLRDWSWSASRSTRGRNEANEIAAHLLLFCSQPAARLWLYENSSHSDTLARQALLLAARAPRGDPRGCTGRGRRVVRCFGDRQSAPFDWLFFCLLPPLKALRLPRLFCSSPCSFRPPPRPFFFFFFFSLFASLAPWPLLLLAGGLSARAEGKETEKKNKSSREREEGSWSEEKQKGISRSLRRRG